jgi:DNA-directed RNA polymerase specialized sigma24 family protein
MTLVEYLEQYRAIQRKIKRLEDRLEIERTRAERTTRALSFIPKEPGYRDDGLLARLADTGRMYKKKYNAALQLQREIEDFIEAIPDALSQQVLRMRFIDLLKWEEIADALSYSLRQTMRLYVKALESAGEIWNREEK